MPPIRSETSQKLACQEGKILLALSDLENGRINSLRAAAKLYEIPFSTLQARADGRIARVDKRLNRFKLTELEEDSLVYWIISMDICGAAPRPATIGEMANILLAARGSQPPPTVGKNWPSKFVERRDELRTRYSVRYDYQRALNEDPKALRAWFATVQSDIYNFDEIGFAMGLISSQKVVTRAEFYGRRRLLQPGNREWVTAIESICADGYSLPLCVIFKGKLFIPSTNSRVRGRFRLLILDGHGSHLTPQFDRICAENDIIPLCMPAYSSHLLQLLDVGCFAVIKRAYGRFVSDLARTGYNHIDNFAAKTPRTVIRLYKQASILKDLLKQRSNSPPSLSKTILDRIIKGHSEALHNTALLAQENANLRMANERIVKKRNRSNRKIPYEEGLTVEEGLQLATQLDLPEEAPRVESHTQGELPSQADRPATRAPPRCSGCREIGHRINVCKNRYI
ncbi:hypothetical protein PMG11_07422 [Penicillium brasilianum]|uniref:HTH CENPB-type domain-containing protein n=1 Tax=Penicillium brasilianum TaxID=104259 RepID=A0A0F7TSJ5_PENBI|nr:hypothetical protein PMG11_07422 [Penicillium brasilianum]